MKVPSVAHLAVALAAALAVLGCSPSGAAPTPAQSAAATPLASPGPSLSASPASLAPTPTVDATPAAEATSSGDATPTPIATPTSTPTASPDVPPTAFITADEGDVEGWLGSYCWYSLCADVPAIPGVADLPEIRPMPEEVITFALADGSTFNRWRAAYWTADNEEPIEIGAGGEGFDPDVPSSTAAPPVNEVDFPAPPGGDGTLHVQVFFFGGDLSYYWHSRVALLPPEGFITGPGSSSIEGHRGSWCYETACADIPIFSKSDQPTLQLSRRGSLTFELTDLHPFGYIHATYAAEVESGDVHELVTAGVYDPESLPSPAPPMTALEFDGPPQGDWFFDIFILFPNNGGDASYFWHAIVR